MQYAPLKGLHVTEIGCPNLRLSMQQEAVFLRNLALPCFSSGNLHPLLQQMFSPPLCQSMNIAINISSLDNIRLEARMQSSSVTPPIYFS